MARLSDHAKDASIFNLTEMNYQRILFLFFTIIVSILNVEAQELSKVYGKISNENGEAVPFGAIYIESLQKSSMANEEGEFQISIPTGNYKVMFQSLSYERKVVDLSVTKSEQELNVSLRTIAIALDEVEIDPNSEDPAYNVIRKSMAMAEYYKKQREAFKANLYARTSFEVKDIPWLFEKLMDEEDKKDLDAGYILETLAEYSYQKGGKVKERIIAQKSAVPDSSMMGSNFVNLDFYDLGGSGIINPLSRSSFSVYKFEYLASLYEEERLVHRIKVIPRRKGSDLMKGEIYINDQLWNVNKVDVAFKSPNSDVQYKQIYQEVNENVWFPMHHQIDGNISILGLKVDFRYLAAIKEVEVTTDPKIDQEIKEKIELQKAVRYQMEEAPEVAEKEEAPQKAKEELSRSEKREEKINELIQKEKLTKMESLKLVKLIKKQQAEEEAKADTTENLEIIDQREVIYEDSALSKNDSLWEVDREIPLTEEDKKIYVKADSIKKVDDGDTIVNKERSIVGDIFFFNGRLKTENKALILRPKGILAGVGGYFNTVDGYTITKVIGSIEKNKKEGKYYFFEPTLGYAFSRDRVLGEGIFKYQFNKENSSLLSLKGGSMTTDFNGAESMDPAVNTIASLFFLENFPKFYQRNYIELKHSRDFGNSVEFEIAVQYNERERLENNSDQDISLVKDKEYSDNTPENYQVFLDPEIISSHQSGIVEASIFYQEKRRYRYSRGKKIKYNSSKPRYWVSYRQGVPDLFDSDVQFSLIKAGIQRSFSYRLIDRITYKLEYGKFLNKNQLYFADYQAFNVNPFEFNFSSEINSFALLPYYGFNSSDYYVQAHTSLRNNFILLKYLPLLNRTNWKEEIGISYLYTEQELNFYEVSYGLSQILLMLDVKAYASFIDDEYSDFGIRVSFFLGEGQ